MQLFLQVFGKFFLCFVINSITILWELQVTHFHIIVVLRFPPKIVTTTTALALTVPSVARRAGGSMPVSTPIWMVCIIMVNTLLPGKVWTGTSEKAPPTPLNELKWKSNQSRSRAECFCMVMGTNSWVSLNKSLYCMSNQETIKGVGIPYTCLQSFTSLAVCSSPGLAGIVVSVATIET